MGNLRSPRVQLSECALVKTLWQYAKKAKLYMGCPSNSTPRLGVYFREMPTQVPQELCAKTFIAALFVRPKNEK